MRRRKTGVKGALQKESRTKPSSPFEIRRFCRLRKETLAILEERITADFSIAEWIGILVEEALRIYDSPAKMLLLAMKYNRILRGDEYDPIKDEYKRLYKKSIRKQMEEIEREERELLAKLRGEGHIELAARLEELFEDIERGHYDDVAMEIESKIHSLSSEMEGKAGFLTVKEAAEMLGVSDGTIRKALKEDYYGVKIRHVRDEKGRILLHREDIEEICRRRKHIATIEASRQENLITVKEAAEMLGVTESAIRYAIKDGCYGVKIRHVRYGGGRILLYKEDIEEIKRRREEKKKRK